MLFEEKLKIFDAITRQSMDDVLNELWADRYMECLAQGNLTKDDICQIYSEFCKHIPAQQKPERMTNIDAVPIYKVKSDATQGNNAAFRKLIRVPGSNPDETNGASVVTIQVADDTLENWNKLLLYSQIVGQKAFDELRTKKQLGYIVGAQPQRTSGTRLDFLYIVQSEKLPWECTKHITEFIDKTKREYFGGEKPATSDNEEKKDGEKKEGEDSKKDGEETKEGDLTTDFDTYRKSLITQLEEKPKKLAREFTTNWGVVRDRREDFTYTHRSIEYLKQLTLEEFTEFAKSIDLNQKPSVTVEIYPSEMEEPSSEGKGDASKADAETESKEDKAADEEDDKAPPSPEAIAFAQQAGQKAAQDAVQEAAKKGITSPEEIQKLAQAAAQEAAVKAIEEFKKKGPVKKVPVVVPDMPEGYLCFTNEKEMDDWHASEESKAESDRCGEWVNGVTAIDVGEGVAKVTASGAGTEKAKL
jgi:secreted Zn-dependent insulinase-like peptidase